MYEYVSLLFMYELILLRKKETWELRSYEEKSEPEIWWRNKWEGFESVAKRLVPTFINNFRTRTKAIFILIFTFHIDF